MTDEDKLAVRQILREELSALASPWLDTKHAEAYAAGGKDNLINLRKYYGLQRHRVQGKYLYSKREIDRAIEHK